MSAQLKLRVATADDAPALADFATTAFRDTYREINDPEDIASYVAEHFRPDAVAAVIGDPKSTILLAVNEANLAGYAILRRSDAPSCVNGPNPIELARLYVGKALIGQGLGAKLMLEAHAEARRQGARTVWLGVYDRNVRAVQFYERFGFLKVGGKEFMFGARIYIDPIYAASVRDDA